MNVTKLILLFALVSAVAARRSRDERPTESNESNRPAKLADADEASDFTEPAATVNDPSLLSDLLYGQQLFGIRTPPAAHVTADSEGPASRLPLFGSAAYGQSGGFLAPRADANEAEDDSTGRGAADEQLQGQTGLAGLLGGMLRGGQGGGAPASGEGELQPGGFDLSGLMSNIGALAANAQGVQTNNLRGQLRGEQGGVGSSNAWLNSVAAIFP